MTRQGKLRIALLLSLLAALAGCSSVPEDVTAAVLRPFDSTEEPSIQFARRVDPLPEDEAVGAAEVWCVNVSFQCWSCGESRWHTCVSSFLVRWIGDRWEATEVASESEWEDWMARGCPREEDRISRIAPAAGPALVSAAAR
jgi:hypothetical protein